MSSSSRDVTAPLGILCALPQELELLGEALSDQRDRSTAGFTGYAGVLDDRHVVLAQAGVGKLNAAATATLLVERSDCRALVLSGVAGGLADSLSIGDLVIADRVVDIDYGRVTSTERITYQPGTLPLPEVTPDPGYRLPDAMAERIRRQLEMSGLEATLGTILTTDGYLAAPGVRDELAARWGGLAIEMEGAAMCGVAERFGLPWLVVRALSDRAGEDSLEDFSAFLSLAAANSARLLRSLLPVFDS